MTSGCAVGTIARYVRYQLLLRFPGDAFDDFEDIVDLESQLAEPAGRASEARAP